ncbi:hypothetical protein CLG94_09700 [Candidatus Methylomirabilis limnetica]|uniref:Uncharacterized protein n=1 Tax=Candidatus Methylomirabilis limnetica TaxID=2033718 RepID=A0A2T4TWP6_9BACT|nr:hypothetical protein [Candidatus Methylomirabilis limnetica]PTL35533.1 hypothetical protein CLG94_09700 [Candidatus Methylomirabilis limnetica]
MTIIEAIYAGTQAIEFFLREYVFDTWLGRWVDEYWLLIFFISLLIYTFKRLLALRTEQEIRARLAWYRERFDHELREGRAAGENCIRAEQAVIELSWVLEGGGVGGELGECWGRE